jgi:hypothetical protein
LSVTHLKASHPCDIAEAIRIFKTILSDITSQELLGSFVAVQHTPKENVISDCGLIPSRSMTRVETRLLHEDRYQNILQTRLYFGPPQLPPFKYYSIQISVPFSVTKLEEQLEDFCSFGKTPNRQPVTWSLEY